MGFSAKRKSRMTKTGRNLTCGEVNLKVKGNGKKSFSITGFERSEFRCITGDEAITLRHNARRASRGVGRGGKSGGK